MSQRTWGNAVLDRMQQDIDDLRRDLRRELARAHRLMLVLCTCTVVLIVCIVVLTEVMLRLT